MVQIRETVERICGEQQVSNADLFVHVVARLLEVHASIWNFSSADGHRDLSESIAEQVRMAGWQEKPPRTILEVVEMLVQLQAALDHHNQTPYRDAGQTQQADNFAKRFKIGHAILSIIKALKNEAEHRALQQRLQWEAAMEKEGKKIVNPDPKQKFSDLDRMIRETKEKGVQAVMIHHPEVLGDNYAELVTNLNKLADAELALVIVPQSDRKGDN